MNRGFAVAQKIEMKTRLWAAAFLLAYCFLVGQGAMGISGGDGNDASRGAMLVAKDSAAALLAPASSVLAATSPMGWNSWDGYGTTVNEQQVKENAEWFAKHLKPLGWQYITIDMEWFVTNPHTGRELQDFAVRHGCEWPLHSGGESFSIVGGWQGFQTHRRLHPFAGAEIWRPHFARHPEKSRRVKRANIRDRISRGGWRPRATRRRG